MRILRLRLLALLALALVLSVTPAYAAATKDVGFPVVLRDASTAGGDPFAWTAAAFTTPGTNRLVVAITELNGPVARDIATHTSQSLTWTLAIRGGDTAGENYRVEVWTAWAAAVVTGEIVSQTYTGGAYITIRAIQIFSIAGSDATGVGDTSINSTGADPTLAITATAAGSWIGAGLVEQTSGSDNAVSTNTTSEYDSATGGGFGHAEKAASFTGGSTGAGDHTLAYAGDDPVAWYMAGVEIKAVAGGATGPPLGTFGLFGAGK